MNLLTSKHQLLDHKTKLFFKWNKVQEVWQDEQANYFNKTYIERLEREMKVSLETIDALAEMFKKIEEDCLK